MNRRRRSAGMALSRFFEGYNVSKTAVSILADMARVQVGYPQEEIRLSSPRSSNCILLQHGCVLATSHGVPRLWKGRAFFGTGALWEGSYPIAPPKLITRGSVTAIFVQSAFLKEVASVESTLALALLRMNLEQQQIMEQVYGVNGESPVSRVAGLLNYLSVLRHYHVRDEQSKIGMQTRVTVEGPTQVDMADALGLGRATVEKSLATLRKAGVLKVSPPGSRKNRYYEITDGNALKMVALGAHAP
ncbi:helix-turn-helix domain-containing protein [Streptomyces sp. NPDC001815]|uniref:helix-turn-helix domain-containing protein n=1 Tax=Streptomyces sp. NPDC001815 TaxID=3154526 RepID=UPI00332AEAB3